MAFQYTSKSISLDGSVLKASCLQDDRSTYTDSSIDLNDYIGIINGDFNACGSGFYTDAKNITFNSSTVVLSASLPTTTSQNYIDRTFELGFYVSNNNGSLGFNQPTIEINSNTSVVPSSFSIQGGILSGLAYGIDGHLHPTTINLDNWLGNNDGDFKYGGTNWSATATNVTVYNDQGVAVALKADLTKEDGTVNEGAVYTLDTPFINYRGSFATRGN